MSRKYKLAIPDLISNSYFPAAAAVELGFFKKEGLDVDIELIFPVDKCYASLRDGEIDFVAGSAHSALSAFPNWKGVKLLCATARSISSAARRIRRWRRSRIFTAPSSSVRRRRACTGSS